jgi:hypothetical protein
LNISVIEPRTLEIEVQTKDHLFQGQKLIIRMAPGVTTLVGPNGTGKTQVLRALKLQLTSKFEFEGTARKVRYLSAGRASPFERFRASVDTPHGYSSEPAHVGNTQYRESWFGFESLTGDYLALEQRADLRLKVQA